MPPFNGTDDGDTLYGTNDGDIISTFGGDDVLKGFGGADALDGGDGIDSAFYGDSTAAVTVNLATGVGSGGSAQGDTLVQIENLYGSAHADTLTGADWDNDLHGLAGDDILSGRDGTDRLYGEDGLDTLSGGAGADRLDGGAGIDTASYIEATTGVRIDLVGLGNGANGQGGDAEGDILIAIENLIGSNYSDTLNGNDVANVLLGGGGNDEIDGR